MGSITCPGRSVKHKAMSSMSVPRAFTPFASGNSMGSTQRWPNWFSGNLLIWDYPREENTSLPLFAASTKSLTVLLELRRLLRTGIIGHYTKRQAKTVPTAKLSPTFSLSLTRSLTHTERRGGGGGVYHCGTYTYSLAVTLIGSSEMQERDWQVIIR